MNELLDSLDEKMSISYYYIYSLEIKKELKMEIDWPGLIFINNNKEAFPYHGSQDLKKIINMIE